MPLSRTDQECEATTWSYQARCQGENRVEALDGAEGNYGEGLVGQGFRADILYIDVRQCKGADDLVEEGGFLVIGFDQGEGDLRGPKLDGDAGKSGAGAEVGESDFLSLLRSSFLLVH